MTTMEVAIEFAKEQGFPVEQIEEASQFAYSCVPRSKCPEQELTEDEAKAFKIIIAHLWSKMQKEDSVKNIDDIVARN